MTRERTTEEFGREREALNELVMRYAGLTMKRFWGLDSQAYRDGALPRKTKELLGLAASLVLRCDDCVTYHLMRCGEEGVSDAELEETLAIGLIVGGSITIPHVRRAFKAWDGMKKRAAKAPASRGKGTRRPSFAALRKRVARILARPRLSRDERLSALCTLLRAKAPGYDWVGFYIVDPAKRDELVLGPFAGEPTEHVRIPFGRGICGQAAAGKRTFVVQDVGKETNYLACSLNVKAEIVVPVLKKGKVVAELDVDSHTPAAFGEADRAFLEELCASVARLFR